MFTLIVGGAASGKSEYTPSWQWPRAARRLQLHTCSPRRERASASHGTGPCGAVKGFERGMPAHNLAAIKAQNRAQCLLECLSNLAANDGMTRR